jgi:uncharacterized membrane protein YsdA (DUF1294 family)
MNWFKRKPVQSTLSIALAVAAALTVVLWHGLSGKWIVWPWILCWLIAINATTFGMYGIDKYQARHEGWRIPEKTLLALGFIGGTLGAWMGMQVFRHKTIKGPFRLAFWLLFGIQAALAGIVAWEMWF